MFGVSTRIFSHVGSNKIQTLPIKDHKNCAVKQIYIDGISGGKAKQTYVGDQHILPYNNH